MNIVILFIFSFLLGGSLNATTSEPLDTKALEAKVKTGFSQFQQFLKQIREPAIKVWESNKESLALKSANDREVLLGRLFNSSLFSKGGTAIDDRQRDCSKWLANQVLSSPGNTLIDTKHEPMAYLDYSLTVDFESGNNYSIIKEYLTSAEVAYVAATGLGFGGISNRKADPYEVSIYHTIIKSDKAKETLECLQSLDSNSPSHTQYFVDACTAFYYGGRTVISSSVGPVYDLFQSFKRDCSGCTSHSHDSKFEWFEPYCYIEYLPEKLKTFALLLLYKDKIASHDIDSETFKRLKKVMDVFNKRNPWEINNILQVFGQRTVDLRKFYEAHLLSDKVRSKVPLELWPAMIDFSKHAKTSGVSGYDELQERKLLQIIDMVMFYGGEIYKDVNGRKAKELLRCLDYINSLMNHPDLRSVDCPIFMAQEGITMNVKKILKWAWKFFPKIWPFMDQNDKATYFLLLSRANNDPVYDTTSHALFTEYFDYGAVMKLLEDSLRLLGQYGSKDPSLQKMMDDARNEKAASDRKKLAWQDAAAKAKKAEEFERAKEEAERAKEEARRRAKEEARRKEEARAAPAPAANPLVWQIDCDITGQNAKEIGIKIATHFKQAINDRPEEKWPHRTTILGILKMTKEQWREAYKLFVLFFHPDKLSELAPPVKTQYEEYFKIINNINDIINKQNH